MRFLRSNTAVIISVGPFYEKTTGVDIETALTITNERITLTADTDDGAAPTNILDNITGATSGTANDLNYITGGDAGLMQLELSAANVNRVGRMFLSITDAANHVPVFHEFIVLPQAIYDWLIAGTIIPLPANMTQIDGQATTGNNATLNLKQLNIVNNAGTALVASSTGSNGHGMAASGNGSGEGLSATGGATGNGIEAIGGGTSGHGMRARAQGVGNSNGLAVEALGTGSGFLAAGGTTGNGFYAIGGSGDVNSTGAGFRAEGGSKGPGMLVQGSGDGDGFDAIGTGAGSGIWAGTFGGNGDGITAVKAGTGVDIRGNLTGNITGALSGSVGSVTAGVTLAASAVQAIWDALTTALTTAGSIGKRLADFITGDAFVRLGALAGASVSADLLVIDNLVDDLESRLGTPSDLGSGASVAANLVDIEAQTDDIGVAGAGLTAVATAANLAVLAAYVDTEVAAIKAQTDQLVFTVANRVDATTQAGLSTLDAAGVRSAVGLASADLDTQLAALPTAAEAADAVWDEMVADHLDAGSTGLALNSAGAAGDPWGTALPGVYGAGTAGKILGDNLDVTVTSRASQASVDDLPTNAELATALGTADDAVLAAIAALNNLSAVGAQDAAEAALLAYQAAMVGDAMTLTAGERTAIADATRARQLTEGYAADGVAPTWEQATFMILQGLLEFGVVGTTLTTRKLDKTTPAMAHTLDSALAPTTRTRAT